jgi:hypothetical protein
MKTKLLIAVLFIANMLNAQITFENLTVPAVGYFNGTTEYSGSGTEEIITYEDGIANFYVKYTDTGTYDYWNGFAYSNQTDLTTASYTNYSAYSSNGGGANGSSNYCFVYSYASETMTFDDFVLVPTMQIANSVWGYRYMTGTDGVGTGTYETGDYLKLTITAVTDDNGTLGDNSDDTLGDSIDFYLADFTNGNSYIIDDWTTVDLSSLGNVKGLKFQLSSIDDMTPYYFAMDDIIYETLASTSDNSFANQIEMYPNPTIGKVTLNNVENSTITLIDINGRKVFSKENCLTKETISLQNIHSGIYFVKIENNNQVATKKLIVK